MIIILRDDASIPVAIINTKHLLGISQDDEYTDVTSIVFKKNSVMNVSLSVESVAGQIANALAKELLNK